MQYSDTVIALAIVGIIFIIIVPIPAILLDILFTLSIGFALVILLLTIFTTETLQLSVFPSLLLVSTLFRLSLNVSSTRLILRDASAGEIINAFGNFVVGGNYIVGFIIFIIITVIQFVVITNGAGRVAEVTARFTLDAMPGKQMSIDADFNAGLIDDNMARDRRITLQQEADFYGSMDGASKFVKGDAIAGLIIVLVNLVGGLAIGVIQLGLPIEQAVREYTLLTVGDGLVGQIPAILISTASGILVTRSTNHSNLGQDLSKQLLGFPKVIAMSAGIILILGLVPGLPFWPFFIMAAGAGFGSYLLLQDEKDKHAEEVSDNISGTVRLEPENFHTLASVDLLGIELGYNLLRLTEKEVGGDLLERITAFRRQFVLDTGLVIQPIRVRDNLQLSPNRYVLKLKGNVLATSELQIGRYLAMNPGGIADEIEGIPTKEPTFGLDALWIERDFKDEAEMSGYTVVDEITVLTTHLTEVVKSHAHELLGRQEVKLLIDNVRQNQPAVVDELIPNMLSIGEVQKVLQNLLREKIPIRDTVTILEALADHASGSKDIDYLTEMVRQSMSRTICNLFAGEDNKLYVLTLDSVLEQEIAESLQHTPQGTYPVLDPSSTNKIFQNMVSQVEHMTMKGREPIALVSPRIRLPLRRLLERSLPQITLLSFNEIIPGVQVEAVGVVAL
ncbi:MAG: flagellar biosynthesis protein FlhA [Firmicutes bacterium]|nr:flagellar biosynthesis protein FlhA [Bacillota bacterium]